MVQIDKEDFVKICLIFSNLGHSGAERVVSIISNELINRGHQVHICLTTVNPKIDYEISPNVIIDNIEIGGFV